MHHRLVYCTFLFLTIISTSMSDAGSISINFTNGDADKSLSVAENAGVVPQTNWNGHTNATGSQATPNLIDNSGTTTTASVTTTFGFSNTNGGGTGTTDDKLYRAYGLISNTESIAVSNLPSTLTSNSYDVIVYFDLNLGVAARTFSYSIGSTTLAGLEDTNFFSGTFKKATGTSIAAATQGNYVRFTGLTTASFTITGSASIGRAPICGIQIISNTTPPPNIISFTSSASTFTSGEDITLAWSVTGASSVTIDQGIGTVAASDSVLVSPDSSTIYTLTALNETTSSTAQVNLTLSKGVIRVYLLGGQSNMQGVGRKSKLATELLELPEILFYHSNDVSSTAGANTWTTLRPAGFNSVSFGPEIGFGQVIADLCAGQNIAFIKHAFGGSSLQLDWNPGANASDTINWGLHFAKFVSTVNSGISALQANGWQPEIHGMIWQQGEQDAKDGINANGETSTSADDYGLNLSNFIARIREQFSPHASSEGIRFVSGQVLPYAPVGGDVVTRFTGRDLVRQAILNSDEHSGAPLAVTNAGAVATNSTEHPTHEQEIDGYRDTDEVHLSATAQLTLGRSMAYEMLKLSPTTYSEWSTDHGLTGGQNDDDDHDGINNLGEFFLGSNPLDSTSISQPTATIETIDGKDYLTLSFPRNLNALNSVGTAQVSDDLVNWNNGTAPIFIESIKHTDDIVTLKYRAPWHVSDGSHSQIFLRLQITP